MPRSGLASLRAALTLDHRSLSWRISWLLALMAILIVTTFGLFAYRTARATTLTATHARLRSALSQINTIAELGVVNQLDNLRGAARDPRVVDALRHPAGRITADPSTPLAKLRGPASSVELLDAAGTVVYTSDPDFTAATRHPSLAFSPDGAIGPIFDQGDVQMFDAGVTVQAEGATIGTVRVTRRLGRGANRRIIAGLLGEDGTLLIGNQDRTVWGDAGAATYPSLASPISYARDGRTWVSVSAEVRGTPWLYAVELPERVAIAPARALLTPLLTIGGLIAVGAAVAGLILGRKITSPLADLTKAAEAIARGDRQILIEPAERRDEIGRLALAFSTMASSVHAVRDRLESEVDERAGALSAAVDRLRSLDDELRRNERLATLGRMSGSIGHELRNPLGVMSTVVFLLDALPDASPKLKHYSGLLREQIRLSERIISDLLDRARSGAAVQTVVNVSQFIDDLLKQADIPVAVQVERRVSSALPPVSLDRDRVGQVLWNLITNAVQAMNESGSLTISAAVQGDRMRVEVQDSGPGIHAVDHERIFEPLYTTKPAGVGLGLAISRAYARSVGGNLFVDVREAPGACMVLEVPVTVVVEGRAT
nr:HAMP domain-containing protein [Acidobacteriota bacterium]